MQPTKHFDRYQFLKEPIVQPKKLTFEEWAVSVGYGYWYAPGKLMWSSGAMPEEEEVRMIWKAAQENK
jgi:hypothetical protein